MPQQRQSNRAPDPAGLQFWLNALADGETLTQVANQFANSFESLALYPYLSLPNVVNAGTFVTQVYNNILNCAPDAPGLAFWTNQLTSGSVTPGSFIVTVEASVNMQTGTADALTLAPKQHAVHRSGGLAIMVPLDFRRLNG
jgi:Domain of unknown function (DUF4214)